MKTEIICNYCGYKWIYKGKMIKATCPSCHNNTPVSKQTELVSPKASKTAQEARTA